MPQVALVPRRSVLTRRLATGLLAATAGLLLLACTSNDDLGRDFDFAGVWDAQISVLSGPNTGAQFPVILTISQNGRDIFGTFTSPGGAAGTLIGTVRSNQAEFTIVQDPPCAGNFEGNGYITDRGLLLASYGGTACNGPLTAELTATRR